MSTFMCLCFCFGCMFMYRTLYILIRLINKPQDCNSVIYLQANKAMKRIIIQGIHIIFICFLQYQKIIADGYLISGNLTIWDSIFASRSPTIILESSTNNLSWTEGPVVINEKLLYFSDTIQNNIYSLNLDTNETVKVFENSGDAPPEELVWRAEPGSNGLAHIIDPSGQHWLVVCQHGGRRISIINIQTGQRYPLVERADGGKKLNGPNDVNVHQEKDGTYYIYFTDPVYAWLEKDRFQDLPYLDDRVQEEGPSFCGVFRVRLPMDMMREKNKMKEFLCM